MTVLNIYSPPHITTGGDRYAVHRQSVGIGGQSRLGRLDPVHDVGDRRWRRRGSWDSASSNWNSSTTTGRFSARPPATSPTSATWRPRPATEEVRAPDVVGDDRGARRGRSGARHDDPVPNGADHGLRRRRRIHGRRDRRLGDAVHVVYDTRNGEILHIHHSVVFANDVPPREASRGAGTAIRARR